MTKSVLILGRQPALGLAELESLYGPDAVQPAGDTAAILDLDPEAVSFFRLGGSIKLAKLLAKLDTTNWDAIEKYLRKTIPEHLQYVPKGKLKLGLSAYGLPVSAGKINAAALTLKKVIRATGRSVRIVPNKEPELNSAQVVHNGLTSPTGLELILIRNGDATLLAQTTAVQDINAYAARDQLRPKRDARVGMLPPKLAQIIVNLAGRQIDSTQSEQNSNQPHPLLHLLDPFCGTGVILQEALLMGYTVTGTDLEPRMVEYTEKNLAWLQEHYATTGTFVTAVGDATAYQWNPAPVLIAAETYLGQPFNTLPDPAKLEQVRSGCNLILKKFLQNVGKQIKPGTRLCLAVPAWQRQPGRFLRLPALDQLGELGYNRLSFEHVRTHVQAGVRTGVQAGDLIYARAGQIVARELLVLTKK